MENSSIVGIASHCHVCQGMMVNARARHPDAPVKRSAASALFNMNALVEGRTPLPCLANMAEELTTIVAEHVIAGVMSRSLASDELGSGWDILSASPWTKNLFPTLLALRAALLCADGELRAEEGSSTRGDIRRCLKGLDKIRPNSPRFQGAARDKALLLVGTSMLHLADGGSLLATDCSRQALMSAKTSGDTGVYKISLFAQSRAFDAMGDQATAAVFQNMADQIKIANQCSVWLTPYLWVGHDDNPVEAAVAL
jgi:hypothetical protein